MAEKGNEQSGAKPKLAPEKTPEEKSKVSLYDFLNSTACEIQASSDLCGKIIEERKKQAESTAECLSPNISVPEQFFFNTQGLYELDHPQVVIGAPVSQRVVDFYAKEKREAKAGKHPNQVGLEELRDKYGRIGKIAIWKTDPLLAPKGKAVSEFVSKEVDGACEAAGLSSDACILYHVIAYENSGSLWAESPGAGAVGPSQLMTEWYTLEKNRRKQDGIETTNFYVAGSDGKEVGLTAPDPKHPEDLRVVMPRRVTFDGRYDPVTNLEVGARAISSGLDTFGESYPDFAVLYYNQGPALFKVIKEWAKKYCKVDYQEFYCEWEKANFNAYLDRNKGGLARKIYKNTQYAMFFDGYKGQADSKGRLLSPYKYFLDYLGQVVRGDKPVTVAEILRDTELCQRTFKSKNGGLGYLSKILAVYEIFKNPVQYGVSMDPTDEAFPAVLLEDGKTEFKWRDLFEERYMESGVTLAKFADSSKIDLGTLMYVNRQVKDPYVGFSFRVRLWVPKSNIPKNYADKITSRGQTVLKNAIEAREKYLKSIEEAKAGKDNKKAGKQDSQKAAPKAGKKDDKAVPKAGEKPQKAVPKTGKKDQKAVPSAAPKAGGKANAQKGKPAASNPASPAAPSSGHNTVPGHNRGRNTPSGQGSRH